MAEKAPAAPVARSPLDGHVAPLGGPHDAGVALSEVTDLRLLNLRGNPSAKRFTDAVRKAVGAAPPGQPNTVAVGEHGRVLWLGPDEWLIAAKTDIDEEKIDGLEAALAAVHHSIVDLSDNYAVIAIQGPRVRWVLAKGWPNDLQEPAFGRGHCAQGMLAHAQVILEQTAVDGYQLYVRPSFAAYLWDWLIDAAGEVGYRIEREADGS